MRTAGVDLAAEAKGTALAVIEWTPDAATLVDLQLGVDDARIVDTAPEVDKLGIDCALGWPDAFVEFVSAHSAGRIDGPPVDGPPIDGGIEWRRTLAYRETDRRTRVLTGRWPLSVSTDRLGLTAMRCAGLLARLAERGFDIDRAGSGLVAEVYPGASLRLWGFDTRGYRADAAARRRLLALVTTEAPWLHLSGFVDAMVSSGDAFDAVIAALAARNAALGRYEPPASDHLEQARREGWIALPVGPLHELLAATGDPARPRR